MMLKLKTQYLRSIRWKQSLPIMIVILVLASQVSLASSIKVLSTKSQIETLEQSVNQNISLIKNKELGVKARAVALREAMAGRTEETLP